MNNVLDKKFIDFVKNIINYKLVKNSIYSIRDTYDGEFDYISRHSGFDLKAVSWFIDLEFGSKKDDIFSKNIEYIIEKGSKQTKPNIYIDDEINKLITNTKMTNKENGNLFGIVWYLYEGCNGGDSYDITGKALKIIYPDKFDFSDCPTTIHNIGKLLLKYVDNYDEYAKKLQLFNNRIWKESDKLEKFYRKEKKDSLPVNATGITFTIIKKLIENSTLHQDIKDEILDNIKVKYQDIDEVVEYALIVHDDTLCNSIGRESKWLNHFKNNLQSFPVDIVTEHGTILFNKK